MKKINNKQKLKKRQIEILQLLYKFRFLKRTQIQILLKHKHYHRIILWLNELTEDNYIRKYYDKKFAGDISVYSLGTGSRKYFLKTQDEKINTSLLSRIWQEHKYTSIFRNHCMFLADIYISLLSLTEKTNAKLKFLTKTDLHGMDYLVLPHPDAFFSITEKSGSARRFFLDIFDPLPPRPELRKRIKQYLTYYERNYWQDHNKNPFPSIIFITPDEKSKNYLKERILLALKNSEEEIEFYLSTWEEIQKNGINKQVLHRVE